MNIKSLNIVTVAISTLLLIGCQTTTSAPPSDIPQIDNIVTLIPDVPDSDNDYILDDIDECPQTPLHTVVDARGCPFALIGAGLKMEYRAFFTKDSSELSPKYQLELDKVAKKLQEYDTATMRIEGHTSADEVDKKLRSYSLARNRAIIVKNYLIMQHQIDPNRLSTASYGAQRPIAFSDTEEGRSMNRRVYGLAQEPED
uniref:OmpA family protein n=1 Tax=uncultured Psychrobacter sp. TaxID=259303 RepID=UPI00259A8D99|nr:OmpA family protein [uncultured Psychrobacter sp.]